MFYNSAIPFLATYSSNSHHMRETCTKIFTSFIFNKIKEKQSKYLTTGESIKILFKHHTAVTINEVEIDVTTG